MRIKRIYEEPDVNDGYRILVDKLWPRGISKKAAAIDEWNKAIAPSTTLRKWFDHKPERFDEFKKRYQEELKSQIDELVRIKSIAITQNLTLIYAAKDPKINHAIVLLEVLSNVQTER